MCVCLLVCWSAFYRPHEISYFAALPPGGREQDQPSSRAAPRAGASACTARALARMPYNFSTKKSLALIIWCLSKTKPCARACRRVRDWRDFKKKTNMPLPKFSLQFAFSWSVYFSNRTESYSSQIEFAGPMESQRTTRPTFTAEERLERRREQDRRRHEERRARQRREHTQARRDVDCLRCSQARA